MVEISMQSKLWPRQVAAVDCRPQNGGMRRGPRQPGRPKAPAAWRRNFIRQWRIFRGLTIEELAEKSGLAVGTVSAIETMKAGYSPESLGDLARALDTEPGHLLSVDPTADDGMWRLWLLASPEERRLISALARTVIKAPD